MSEFRNDMIVRRVPAAVRERTRENMDVYCMSLGDAFEEAVREYVSTRKTTNWRNSELADAWFYSDFRKFIPSAYVPEALDFERFPLRY